MTVQLIAKNCFFFALKTLLLAFACLQRESANVFCIGLLLAVIR